MKRIIQLTILTILLVPTFVFAKDGISNYYIDLTVEKNGNVTVEELFVLEGSFNGYERVINFQNEPAYTFDGSLESFNGSEIYNGDALVIEEIRSVDVSSNSNLQTLLGTGTLFAESSYAATGEFGKYTITNSFNGKSIRIYNPSSRGQRGFYIKYVITNMAIIHNDVAEIGFNLFTEQREDIDNLEMHIHIPGNQTELRAWGHGPLWGETKNISKEEILLQIYDLDAYQAVDIRFVFDQSVVPESTKMSGVEGLSSILTVETEKAEEANRIREKAKEEQRVREMIRRIVTLISSAWLLGLLFIIFRVYWKHDKEYKNQLPSKYYRDFPDTYGPEIVGYLIHRQISDQDLSASILNLIYKKAIAFEVLEKKDYKLINLHLEELTETEEKLISWLFSGTEEITLSELKKKAKTKYESFLRGYTTWKNSATREGASCNFYEKSIGIKVLCVLYCILGLFLGSLNIYNILLMIIIYISAIVSMIYFIAYRKRTEAGNDAYHKWMALKNFMVDFGNMNEKDLPEITLWEKYLVYAVTLGCAKKLSKTMEIKIKELEATGTTIDQTIFDTTRVHVWLSFNRSLTSTITSAISTAHSTQVANSSSSSSGGFGGGFSGGGGSFGGGGGGGRF